MSVQDRRRARRAKGNDSQETLNKPYNTASHAQECASLRKGECSAPRCRAPFSNIPGGGLPTLNQVRIATMPIRTDIDQIIIQSGSPIAQLHNQMEDLQLFQVSASLKTPVYTPKTLTALQMADPTERTPLICLGAI
jgi:hypothetical protein